MSVAIPGTLPLTPPYPPLPLTSSSINFLAHFKVVVQSQFSWKKSHSNHLPWIEMEHVVTDLSFQEQSGSSTPSQPLQRGNEWGARAGKEAPPTCGQQYSLTDWVWAHEPMSQKQNGRSKSVMHRKHHTVFSLGKNRRVKSIQLRYYCPVNQKTYTSVTQPHRIFEKGLHTLSWDDKYGCLIVQELNIALIHPKFWLLPANLLWKLFKAPSGPGAWEMSSPKLFHREECCTCSTG